MFDWLIALLIVLPNKILDYLDLLDLVAAAVHRIFAVAVRFASWRGRLVRGMVNRPRPRHDRRR
jgi:hypothetical protein